MKSEEIKFGTDGWRGIISEDFTMDRVRIATQGVSNYIKKKCGDKKPVIAIGYDSRFISDRFAAAAADIFSLNDIS